MSARAACFREDGLGRQQWLVAMQGSEAGARCLPRADRFRPTVAIVLTGSSPPMTSSPLFARSAGLETKRQVGKATPWVGHDYSAGDAHQSAVRLVRLQRSVGGLENGNRGAAADSIRG